MSSKSYDSSQYVIGEGSESACASDEYRSSATVGQALQSTQFLRCKQPSVLILDPVIQWVQKP